MRTVATALAAAICLGALGCGGEPRLDATNDKSTADPVKGVTGSVPEAEEGFAAATVVASEDVAAVEAAHDRTIRRQGRELFLREWVPGDPRSHGGDGLGPLYNETSCVACHNLGAPGGAGPASKNVDIVTLVRGRAGPDPTQLDEYHPGFRTSPSVLLHRF